MAAKEMFTTERLLPHGTSVKNEMETKDNQRDVSCDRNSFTFGYSEKED